HRVLDLLAFLVEARGDKDNVKRLPFAWLPACVHFWGDAFVGVMILWLQLGARVDAAAILAAQLLFAEAVGDLDFIMAMKLDAGVGAFGDVELEMDLDVGEFLLGEEIRGSPLGPVVPDSFAFLGEEFLGILSIKLDASDFLPIAVRRLP